MAHVASYLAAALRTDRLGISDLEHGRRTAGAHQIATADHDVTQVGAILQHVLTGNPRWLGPDPATTRLRSSAMSYPSSGGQILQGALTKQWNAVAGHEARQALARLEVAYGAARQLAHRPCIHIELLAS